MADESDEHGDCEGPSAAEDELEGIEGAVVSGGSESSADAATAQLDLGLFGDRGSVWIPQGAEVEVIMGGGDDRAASVVGEEIDGSGDEMLAALMVGGTPGSSEMGDGEVGPGLEQVGKLLNDAVDRIAQRQDEVVLGLENRIAEGISWLGSIGGPGGLDGKNDGDLAADLERASVAFVEQIRAYKADFQRWRVVQGQWARRLTIGGIISGVPVLVLLGILLQLKFEPLAPTDLTNGWKDLVWNSYGRQVVECVRESNRRGGRVECGLIVPAGTK